MEGYFARLAERAALIDAPAMTVAQSAPVVDPFDQTELVTPPLPRSEPPPSSERVIERTNIVYEETESRVTLNVPAPAPEPIVRVEPVEVEVAQRVEVEVAQRLMPETRVVMPPPAVVQARQEEREEKPEAEESEERAEEIRLLRKADIFMERIMGVRAGRPHVADETSALQVETHVVRGPARLQPTQPPPRVVREPEQERTTLTIGTLTVEVVPPAPPPPAPHTTQIVVVRGARGGRSGVPSGRRFGLRQF